MSEELVENFFRIACQTNNGHNRPENLDLFDSYKSADLSIAVVASGLGAPSGAKETVKRVVDDIIASLKAVDVSRVKPKYVKSLLEMLGKELFEEAEEDESKKGIGVIVAGLIILGDSGKGIVFNIGNSRLYRFRENSWKLLTVDHTVEAQLKRESGDLEPLKAGRRPKSHLLTSALGLVEVLILQSDWILGGVKASDEFLLVTDGLHDLVSEEEMQSALEENSKNEQDLIDSLVKLSYDKTSTDNITGIALRVSDDAKMTYIPSSDDEFPQGEKDTRPKGSESKKKQDEEDRDNPYLYDPWSDEIEEKVEENKEKKEDTSKEKSESEKEENDSKDKKESESSEREKDDQDQVKQSRKVEEKRDTNKDKSNKSSDSKEEKPDKLKPKSKLKVKKKIKRRPTSRSRSSRSDRREKRTSGTTRKRSSSQRRKKSNGERGKRIRRDHQTRFRMGDDEGINKARLAMLAMVLIAFLSVVFFIVGVFSQSDESVTEVAEVVENEQQQVEETSEQEEIFRRVDYEEQQVSEQEEREINNIAYHAYEGNRTSLAPSISDNLSPEAIGIDKIKDPKLRSMFVSVYSGVRQVVLDSEEKLKKVDKRTEKIERALDRILYKIEKLEKASRKRVKKQ